jgi:molybdate transport system substrate-binding protein
MTHLGSDVVLDLATSSVLPPRPSAGGPYAYMAWMTSRHITRKSARIEAPPSMKLIESRLGHGPIAIRAAVGAALTLCLALWARPGAADDWVIGAAASLREPVEWLVADQRARHPEHEIAVVFGASSSVAAQIRLGAPIDVFLSANRQLVDDLINRDQIDAESVFAFARNRLVVIAPLEGVAAFDDPGALAAAEIRRVALPSEAVPLGRYARVWLASRGLADVLAPRQVTTEHARATLAAVAAGNADIGIVYASDARSSDRVRVVYAVPDPDAPVIAYYAARTKSARESEGLHPLQRALHEPGFRAALQRADFLTVEGRAHGGIAQP